MAGVSELLPSSFHEAWRDMRDFRHDEYWYPGGRGSLKSTTAALRVVTAIARDPMANAVVFRKHKVDIADSVYAEIEKTVGRLGWSEFFTFNKQPLMVTYNPTGQKILFRGLDDAEKSKSITVANGYIQIAWFEEFNQYDGMEEIDTVLQSVGRGGPKFQMIATYNPPETQAAWVNVEVMKPSVRRLVTMTDYRAVNPDWLGAPFLRLAEELKRTNPRRYEHEYLGAVTGTGGEVFRNFEQRRITDDEIKEFRTVRWGLDFGVCDPTALVGCSFNPNTDTLYIFGEFYESDVLTAAIVEAVKRRGLELVPISCDPGGGGKSLIRELRHNGVRFAQEAYKPSGSVDAGMRWLRDRAHIVIDPARCPNVWREFSTYEYARLRNGAYRNEYPDKDNHAIDAVRYACEDIIFSGKRSRLLI